MTTAAKTNYGTVLKVGDGGSPETFSVIGEIVSMDPPELVHEAVEVTNQSSGGWREFVPGGLKELSEFTVTVNFTEDTITSLYTDVVSGTQRNYQIAFPDDGATTWAFAALVVSVKPLSVDAASPEALQAEVKFRPTGNTVLS